MSVLFSLNLSRYQQYLTSIHVSYKTSYKQINPLQSLLFLENTEQKYITGIHLNIQDPRSLAWHSQSLAVVLTTRKSWCHFLSIRKAGMGSKDSLAKDIKFCYSQGQRLRLYLLFPVIHCCCHSQSSYA